MNEMRKLMEAVRFDEAFRGLTYDAILDSGEDEADAMDYARGMVWNEVELTDNYIKYANHVGSVNDVDVYYDYGADYYFFVPASEGIHESTRLNEDPTAGGRMLALYRDISKLKATTEQIHWDFEKYPNLDEYREVADKITAECHKLQRLFRDIDM